MSLSVASGAPGTTTAIEGRGFGPSETVRVKFDTIALGSTKANASGAFSKVVTVPGAGAGMHTIAAVGKTTGTTGTLTFAVPAPDRVTVTPVNATVVQDATVQFTAEGTWGTSTFVITNGVT